MLTMTPNQNTGVALCARCFCPLDIRQSYRVDLCLPAPPPLPPGIHIHHPPATGAAAHLHPLLMPQEPNIPAPPYEPPNSSQPMEHEQGVGIEHEQDYEVEGEQDNGTEHEQDHGAEGKQEHGDSSQSCCSSTSTSSTFNSVFTDFTINTEFAAGLQATQDMHFSQEPFWASSLPPPLILG